MSDTRIIGSSKTALPDAYYFLLKQIHFVPKIALLGGGFRIKKAYIKCTCWKDRHNEFCH